MIDDKVLLEKSFDGLELIKIVKDNKFNHIGSKYNMTREINNFIEKANEEKGINTLIVFGLYTGEHIKKLIDVNKLVNVYVIEPNINIIKMFMENPIKKELINTGRVFVYQYDKNNLESIINNIITDINLEYFKVVSFSNYELIYGEEYKELLNIIKKRVVQNRLNKNTSIMFSKLWFDIFIRNMLNLKNAYPINNLKNIYKDKTAIIVSAGPSLEKNIRNLKGKEDGLIIITGGRTLGTLLRCGIKPDFVCIIDPLDATYRLVENYLDANVPLIFYEGTNADVVEKYKGPKFFYALKPYVNEFLNKNIDLILSGGSVAVSCLGLALYLGCKNVIFMGQDLAYTDDKLHANNAKLETEKNSSKEKKTFYVKGINGDLVKTSYDLNMFRQIIESIINIYNNINYINATEGGAHIEGTEVMTLKDAIEKYYVHNLKKINIEEFKTNYFDEEIINKKLKYAFEDLKKIKTKCIEGIKIVDEINLSSKIGKKINSKLKKLDLIDEEIKQRFKDNGFSNLIMYPITVEIMSNFEYKVLDTDTEDVKISKVLEMTKKMYLGISKKIEEALEVLENRLR